MDPQTRQFPQPPQPPSIAKLPPLPSLEHLKKQAKHLLAACQGGDAGALERLRWWFPDQAAPFELTQAQLAVAREHGCASWAHLRRSVLRALVDRLAVRHWSEWRAAAAARAALARTGEDGLAAALEGLSHPDPRVRSGAADFFDHHGDDRCVPRLTEVILHDPIPYVRRAALHALSCQRCKPSPLTTDLAPLVGRVVLEDASPRVRWHAMGFAATAQLVRVVREDPSTRMRQRAWAVLGRRRGDALARDTAERALEHPDPAVRRAAHHALRRVSPEYRQLTAQRAREANLALLGTRGPAA